MDDKERCGADEPSGGRIEQARQGHAATAKAGLLNLRVKSPRLPPQPHEEGRTNHHIPTPSCPYSSAPSVKSLVNLVGEARKGRAHRSGRPGRPPLPRNFGSSCVHFPRLPPQPHRTAKPLAAARLFPSFPIFQFPAFSSLPRLPPQPHRTSPGLTSFVKFRRAGRLPPLQPCPAHERLLQVRNRARGAAG